MKNTYNKSMYDVANIKKKSTVKDVSIDIYELLNIQTCSFIMFWNRGCTQSLVGKLQVLSGSPNFH